VDEATTRYVLEVTAPHLRRKYKTPRPTMQQADLMSVPLLTTLFGSHRDFRAMIYQEAHNEGITREQSANRSKGCSRLCQ